MIVFLSLKLSKVLFYLKLVLGYLKTFPLEMGDEMGKSTHAMVGVLASVHVRMMEKGGSTFCHLGVIQNLCNRKKLSFHPQPPYVTDCHTLFDTFLST